MSHRETKRKMALHWKILIGLLAGVVVGLVINLVWTDATWASMGVEDPGSFLSEKLSVREASQRDGSPNADANA